MKSIKIDLHGCSRTTAVEKIREVIENLNRDGIEGGTCTLFIIHGHNNGTILQQFVRNGELEQSLQESFTIHSFGKMVRRDPGTTKVTVKLFDRENIASMLEISGWKPIGGMI